jgi:diguanylate cyclase (GGDEF)-like protein
VKSLINSPHTPDFLIKSTLGVSIVSILILIPFGINNFIQGRNLLGVFTLGIAALCMINAWFCYQGKYLLVINLYGISPVIIIAILFIVNELGVVGCFWAYMVVLAFYYILPEKQAWIVNIIFVVLLLPVAWSTLEQPIAIRYSVVLFATSFYAFLSMREITKQHYTLKNLATLDSLTGLYNRSLLQGSLELAIHQSTRTDTAMALLMLDLDYFKKINDEFGHHAGDSVLKSVARYLKKTLRASDMIFRFGGEEFLVILHNTDESNAIVIAEKLRQGIEQLSLVSNRTITVSIGVSCLAPDMDWKKWMKLSDENLYRAKSSGRNRVIA